MQKCVLCDCVIGQACIYLGKYVRLSWAQLQKDSHTRRGKLQRPAGGTVKQASLSESQLSCQSRYNNQESVRPIYPKLCDILGQVQKPYKIKLKPDAQLFSLKVPRRVPLPLMGKVKLEWAQLTTSVWYKFSNTH